jgi:acid phosphatase
MSGLALVTSCGQPGAGTSTATHRVGQAGTPAAAEPAAAPAAARARRHPSKVLVVMVENHSYAQMRAKMPYLAGLSRRYGYATNWRAITHPSLPNYLAIFGGSTFGIRDDRSPKAHGRQVGRARSIFGQALRAGKAARTYAESMPGTCRRTSYPLVKPLYVARHNPWTYFPGGRPVCRERDVPLSRMAAAVRHNKLPNVGLVVPNLCHDAHNCPLAEADAFLRRILPRVLHSSDFRSGRLVVVVTADEDDGRSGNRVLTSVITTRLHHKVVHRRLTHYSLTRFMAAVLGVRPLRHAATAPRMGRAFGL